MTVSLRPARPPVSFTHFVNASTIWLSSAGDPVAPTAVKPACRFFETCMPMVMVDAVTPRPTIGVPASDWTAPTPDGEPAEPVLAAEPPTAVDLPPIGSPVAAPGPIPTAPEVVADGPVPGIVPPWP